MKQFLLLFILFWVTSNMYAQVSKSVTLTAGGTLSSSLTSTELNTVTNLTLSGSIDTRDFKTMRDLMPALSVLDMSGASIVAYNGRGGTSNASDTYSANTIPMDAFSAPSIFNEIKLSAIKLPASLIGIDKSAFYNCKLLASVSIATPSSLVTIGAMAFQYCSKLATITIPASVTTIGDQAFYNSGASITVDGNNLNYSGIDGVLFNKDKTTLIYCPGTKKGNYTIPSTVTVIEDNAFRFCSGLSGITISPILTKVGAGAFASCSNLTSLSFPGTLNTIGNYAFYNCYGLTSFYIDNTTPITLSSGSMVFSGMNLTNSTLYVPTGSLNLYTSATLWKDFGHIVTQTPLPEPLANAGPDQIRYEGSVVTLDGSTSSNVTTYRWTAPAGITLVNANTATPTFIAPEVTVNTAYTFTLTVSNETSSATDVVIVTVNNVNQVPAANAGIAQTVNEGTTVSLNGSASTDPDGDKLTYLWTAPISITLSRADTATPTFTAPEVNTNTPFTFTLTVSDGSATSTAQVVVTVKQVNKAPIPNAGEAQTAKEGAVVWLNGSASTDPDGDKLTYLWVAPAGITLSNTTSANPSFIAPAITTTVTYTFTLTVSDGVASSTATTTVTLLHNYTFREDVATSNIKIYPNPFTGPVTIDLGEDVQSPARITVYGIQGGLLQQQELFETKTTLNLSPLLTGSYLIKVENGKKIQIKTVIKK